MTAQNDAWVLLISSDAAHRAAWRSVMARDGFQVLEAPDAANALHLLRRSPHALTVLLDREHVPLLNAVVPDRRAAHHHRFLLLCAQGDHCHPRAQAVLDQLPLRILCYPCDEPMLLDAVRAASQALSLQPLYT